MSLLYDKMTTRGLREKRVLLEGSFAFPRPIIQRATGEGGREGGGGGKSKRRRF